MLLESCYEDKLIAYIYYDKIRSGLFVLWGLKEKIEKYVFNGNIFIDFFVWGIE